MSRLTRSRSGPLALALLLALSGALAAETVLVESGSSIRYLANSSNPLIGMDWTAEVFDDSGWQTGFYGVGFENALPGAASLLLTTVPDVNRSIFTRVEFEIADVSAIENLYLGCDFDDGYMAWINGVEVFRSPQMPAGTITWQTPVLEHESSNAPVPDYTPLKDISSAALPALSNGTNVLAVGVWNIGIGSSDLVLVPQLTANQSLTVDRGPYLQLGTPNAVSIRWRTNIETASRVEYGAAPGLLTSAVEMTAGTAEHEVRLTGLIPGTRYYYSIGTATQVLAGDDADHFFVTPPPIGSDGPTRVWVLGDSGTANSFAADVRDAYYDFAGPTHTDLWLMLGDNAYPQGSDLDYQTALFDKYPEMLRKSVLWPTIGNHDGISSVSDTETGPYFDMFSLPAAAEAGGLSSGTEAYYSFDHANIHFVVLDSEGSDRGVAGAMLTWLDQDLAATLQDWIIAIWHHPPYSRGGHISDTELQLQEMRANVVPILDDRGVDLTLCGHSHSYERSFLIDGHYGVSTTFDESMKVQQGGGQTTPYTKPLLGADPHSGIVHTVAGSAGQLSGGDLDHPAMFFSANTLGSVVLDVDHGQLDLRFIDSTGAMLDHFTIIKAGDCSDVDDDGSCDDDDNCPALSNPGQTDGDGDGTGDICDNCPAAANANQTDTDSDGQGDVCDGDDDDDGLLDGSDNCRLIANVSQTDTDGDGYGDACDADDDNDGVADGADNCPLLVNTLQTDTDGDGQGDVCDGDDDNDGLADGADNCPDTTNPAQTNSDGDGQGDACDADDDNDGVADGIDNCPLTANGGQVDNDSDGLGDVCDPDDDNDGVNDGPDNCPFAANAGQTDTDSDGQGDVCDADDDNDGVPDGQDNCPLIANGDQLNSDGDGLGNVCDPDDDNDGVADGADNCPLVANGNQTNTDGDGQGDVCDADDDNDGVPDGADNCPLTANAPQIDTDSDGLGDLCDADDDNDGVADGTDNCPLVTNGAQTDTDGDGLGNLCDPDDDNDGRNDGFDNCPTSVNPLQTDTDLDGQGNACDSDDDNDGVADGSDNCPLHANPAQTDTDGDDQGDACDTDDDGDGVADPSDNCPLNANAGQADNDSDGAGDACDSDDDNDGVADAGDNCVFTANAGQADNDGDGLGNSCDGCPNDPDDDADADGHCADADNCPATANAGQENFDGDSLGDICDPDDDNDGATDGADSDDFDPFVCSDQDGDVCQDCSGGSFDTGNDGPDFDGDGLCNAGDPDDDNDGAIDGADSDDNDPNVCSDADGDSCDDCSGGAFDVGADGLDFDGDGLCDAGDPDDDNDGAPDGADSNDANPNVCSDVDTDSCDDCMSGTFNPAIDGLDFDLDGACNLGDPDDDNDGAADGADSNDANPNVCSDVDMDSCDDCMSGTFNPAIDGLDFDLDGACNLGDPDDDNDGAADGVDSNDANPNVCSDVDGDSCNDCSGGFFNLAGDGPDFDGDGLCNTGDPDDDNDGVLDALDSNDANPFVCRDADVDGCDDCTSGSFNPSADGDDFDNDGLCDLGDRDDDNDGVQDPNDSNDFSPNVCRDIDNDTCDDCTSGHSNPASDGPDFDGDGLCNAGDPDDDNDGALDPADTDDNDPFVCSDQDVDSCDDCSTGSFSLAGDGFDFDGDGLCDAGDADDDNDGALDPADTDDNDPFVCSDQDVDSCDDCSTGSFNLADDGFDFDGDGLCDAGDGDDDNDGALDPADADDNDPNACSDQDADSCDDCSTGSFSLADDGFDFDGDGLCDAGDPDDDNDGATDPVDSDDNDPFVCSDQDGDQCQDCSGGSFDTGNDGPDFDGDGLCDLGDPDDDDDGAPDSVDSDDNDRFVCSDQDGDQCQDCSGGSFDTGNDGPDFDGDGRCDAGDPDDDNDGAIDGADSDDNDPNVCSDADGDSCDDCSGGAFDVGADGLDFDGDGLCDAGDPDDDNDGAADEFDSNDFDPFLCGDGDGDTCEDCSGGSFDPANDGPDLEGDGLCDAGDPDDDGDLAPDLTDNCPVLANADQTDTDGDSEGDACDADDDNDGVLDELDSHDTNPFVCRDLDLDLCDDCSSGSDNPFNDGPDLDGDGLCDPGDPDRDGDGVVNLEDCAPEVVGVAAEPGSIGTSLRLSKAGATVLSWTRAVQGHTSNLYRGTIDSGPWEYDQTCARSEIPGTTATDTIDPPVGTAVFFLVTGTNACGEGPFEAATGNLERPSNDSCAATGADTDTDGIIDVADNCPLTPNPGQADSDADFVGDACDPG